MHYLKYFKDKLAFPKAVVGKESDWLELGEIPVPHGDLWVGDAGVPNRSEGCTVKVPRGRYVVQIKGMDFKGARVPSRVRVFLKGARKLNLGDRRGQAITDIAQVGICDIRELEAIVTKKHLKEFEEDLQTQITETHISTQTFLYSKRRFDMAFVASGFSDGAYDVFALQSDRKIVGLEVEFLPAGYKMVELEPKQITKGAPDKKSLAKLEKLLDACQKGKLTVVRSILRTDPQLINAAGTTGFLQAVTPLHVAAAYGHAKIAEFLLEQRPPIDVDPRDGFGSTPLMHAAEYGYVDIVRLLLKGKPNVNAQEKFGSTAMHAAAYPAAGRAEIVGLLLDAGADLNLRNSNEKKTARKSSRLARPWRTLGRRPDRPQGYDGSAHRTF